MTGHNLPAWLQDHLNPEQNIRVLEPKTGWRDAALRAPEADWLVLTPIVPQNWLQRLVQPKDTKHTAALCSQLLCDGYTEIRHIRGREKHQHAIVARRNPA